MLRKTFLAAVAFAFVASANAAEPRPGAGAPPAKAPLFAAGAAPVVPPAQPAAPAFNADVRPIFKANCTECHGESDKPKGGLDLRLKRFALKGGKSGAAIVEGKPAESLLLERVTSGEMPP